MSLRQVCVSYSGDGRFECFDGPLRTSWLHEESALSNAGFVPSEGFVPAKNCVWTFGTPKPEFPVSDGLTLPTLHEVSAAITHTFHSTTFKVMQECIAQMMGLGKQLDTIERMYFADGIEVGMRIMEARIRHLIARPDPIHYDVDIEAAMSTPLPGKP